MINDGVIENSRKMGEYFRKQAHEIIEKNHPETVNEIRGLGLIDGIQLNKPSGQPVVDLCFKDSNVLINNTNGNVLRFVPPLIVNEEEIDIVIKAVDEAMTKLGNYLGYYLAFLACEAGGTGSLPVPCRKYT